MHQILDARLVIAALRMALLQRRPTGALIVHSDRGMQFASAAYRQVLAEHGLVASMSRKGNCYDNAFIESFWSSLKYEVVYHQRFATFAEARAAIFNYIETFYNRTRLHSSLAYRSPLAFESQLNQKELILHSLSEKSGQPQTDPFWSPYRQGVTRCRRLPFASIAATSAPAIPAFSTCALPEVRRDRHTESIPRLDLMKPHNTVDEIGIVVLRWVTTQQEPFCNTTMFPRPQ
jgi:hypothetical protein